MASKNPILTIVDVSPFIHVGCAYKPNTLRGGVRLVDNKYSQTKFAAGGIAYLFDRLKQLQRTDIVIVSDRNPTVKKGMYPAYKSNRPNKQEISLQRRLCEMILIDCGFRVLVEDGYESDDFMFTVCTNERPDYKEVHLYHGDSDMNVLIDDKTSALPISSKGKFVNRQNFETKALSKEIIPYNAVALHKIVFGDKSDNISRCLTPPVANHLWQRILKSSMLPMCSNKKICEMVLKMNTLEELHPSLMDQLDVVFPIEVPIPEYTGEINTDRFHDWGRAMDANGFGRSGTSPRVERKLQEFAEELESVFPQQ